MTLFIDDICLVKDFTWRNIKQLMYCNVPSEVFFRRVISCFDELTTGTWKYFAAPFLMATTLSTALTSSGRSASTAQKS